ncbi:MAG: D-alanyl-D-alanine carboxypeptidase, partial [Candidatus Gastranaerophilales bacterium]|nr:D-alanyl-D-alanine carboxypeptidase [Candidatus Gastranaerophilales bacterium]
MFKKAFFALILFFFLQTASIASGVSNSINEIINSFDFDKDSVVSISVKNKKTGILVYEKNAYKYLNPASVLKLFTMAASIDTLGEDYTFDTAFYRDDKNNLYLKLAGDPYLTRADLNELALKLKNNCKGRINKIYIDDSIIDTQSYPDGWTIDDYWPNSPKLSPYTVDFNTVKVDFILSEDKSTTRIVQTDDYKFSFINKLLSKDSNDIKLSYDELHNTVNVEGTINSSVLNKEIPVLNPKYFFCNKLNKALNKNGI